MLSLEDKELGKVVIHPTVSSSRAPEWHAIVRSKHFLDDIRIRIAVRMDKPLNMKHCGYVSYFVLGESFWASTCLSTVVCCKQGHAPCKMFMLRQILLFVSV